MMSDPRPYTPPFPFWDVFRNHRRMIVGGTGLVTCIVLCVAVFVALDKVGRTSEGKGAASGAAGRYDKFQEGQTVDRHRNELTDLEHLGVEIRRSIDEFERDAAEYERLRDSLMHTIKAEPLTHVEWVCTFFCRRWQERLPHPSQAVYYRKKLEALTRTPRRALADKEAGYPPDQRVFDALSQLKTRATIDRNAYGDHLKLLNALARQIGESPLADPRTIQAAVLQLEDELMLREFESSVKEAGKSREGRGGATPSSEAGSGTPASTSQKEEDGLLDALKKKESDARANVGKTKLIRDELRPK